MFKQKSVVFVIFCTLGAVAFVVFFLSKGLNASSCSYTRESFNVSDDWRYCDQISLNTDISSIQINDPPVSLSITIQNNSSAEIEFLYESLSLQKMGESGKWLNWTSTTSFDEVGAEIQKYLSPGDSLDFSTNLSDLIPVDLLTVGSYRLFFPFTYRTQESDGTGGRIDISYGYAACDINMQ